MTKTIEQHYRKNDFLRHCPWCGNPPALIEEQCTVMGDYYISPKVAIRNEYSPDTVYRVRCNNERCPIKPESQASFIESRDAIHAWNKPLERNNDNDDAADKSANTFTKRRPSRRGLR